MTRKRPQSVDALYDQRYHDAAETGALGMDEIQTIEAGRLAMTSLQKTLDLWLTVGEAIKVLRHKADLDGRKPVFKRLMRQNGFAMDEPNKVIDPGLVTHLLDVLKHKADVIKWHESLTPKQKREWAAPNTIKKHCPIFAKPVDPDKEKPMTKAEQDRMALAAALEEIEQLKQREDGDSYNPKTSSAKEIARALFDQLQPYAGKLEKVIKELQALLKPRKPKSLVEAESAQLPAQDF